MKEYAILFAIMVTILMPRLLTAGSKVTKSRSVSVSVSQPVVQTETIVTESPASAPLKSSGGSTGTVYARASGGSAGLSARKTTTVTTTRVKQRSAKTSACN